MDLLSKVSDYVGRLDPQDFGVVEGIGSWSNQEVIPLKTLRLELGVFQVENVDHHET